MGRKVRTTVLRASTGSQVKIGDTLGVWYSGVLANDPSRLFDANFDFITASPTKNPFIFKLGSGQVIKGWDQALVNRRIGEVIEIRVPAALAYGEQGSPPSIPGDSDLIFTVELIAAKADSSANFTFPRFSDLGLAQQTVDHIVSYRRLLQGDSLIGELPANILGSSQDNLLTGLDAGELKADLLIGFSGTNILTGGLGADLLIGGSGADTYRYTKLEDADRSNINGVLEKIVNFDQSEGDKIDLSSIASSRSRKISWIKSKDFSGKQGQLRFSEGLLSLDSDGDKNADLIINLANTQDITKAALIL